MHGRDKEPKKPEELKELIKRLEFHLEKFEEMSGHLDDFDRILKQVNKEITGK
ncbi:MAG: hypothetical protein OXD54_06760 [Candidatus Poribacteria bacterium]|nr:hypothetical protein [Candidatus Poribacteria bacterium]